MGKGGGTEGKTLSFFKKNKGFGKKAGAREEKTEGGSPAIL